MRGNCILHVQGSIWHPDIICSASWNSSCLSSSLSLPFPSVFGLPVLDKGTGIAYPASLTARSSGQEHDYGLCRCILPLPAILEMINDFASLSICSTVCLLAWPPVVVDDVVDRDSGAIDGGVGTEEKCGASCAMAGCLDGEKCGVGVGRPKGIYRRDWPFAWGERLM